MNKASEGRRWAWNIGDALVIHPDATVDELVALTEETPGIGGDEEQVIITPNLVDSFQSLSMLTQHPQSFWSGASDAVLALVGLLGFATCAALVCSWRGVVLPIAGFFVGIFFYSSDVSFSRAFTDIALQHRSTKARQIIVMIALASLVCLPVFLYASAQPYVFSINPVSLLGAVFFGVGMQLGRTSASGMLMSLGAGEASGFVVMAAFCVGSTLGAYHWETIEPVALVDPLWLVDYGGGGVCLHFATLVLTYLLCALIEYRTSGELEVPLVPTPFTVWGKQMGREWMVDMANRLGFVKHRVLVAMERGGMLAIVIGLVVILVTQRAPMGVSSAFAQIGARLAELISPGIVDKWPYFLDSTRRAMLHRTILFDPTFLTDVGFVLGVAAAATVSGEFSMMGWRQYDARSAGLHAASGMLMGYGARFANGCNISGLVGGLCSFSLHGWAWFLAAIPGWWLGMRIRDAVWKEEGAGVQRQSEEDKALSMAKLATTGWASVRPPPASARTW